MKRLAALLLLPSLARTQTPDPARTIAELERELASQTRLLSDWGGLTRYGSLNTELRLDPGVDRVVFLGDEITEMWGSKNGAFFPGKPYLNRGIARQTTPQMLVRFRQDVIGLKPKAVIIQAGLNDLAGFAGPATEGTISENFLSMLDLASANSIRVVLASLTPVCDCAGPARNLTGRIPAARIAGLNAWLRKQADAGRAVYLDYYSALAEGRTMKKDLSADGMIPNEAGYKLMAPLAEQAIARALGR